MSCANSISHSVKENRRAEKTRRHCLLRYLDKPEAKPACPAGWVLDTGASLHVAGRKSFFTQGSYNLTQDVVLGVCGKMISEGRGTVYLPVDSGDEEGAEEDLVLHDVGYSRQVLYNIISISALCDDFGGDLKAVFDKDECVVTRKSDEQLVAWGKRRMDDRTYWLQLRERPDVEAVAQEADNLAKKKKRKRAEKVVWFKLWSVKRNDQPTGNPAGQWSRASS